MSDETKKTNPPPKTQPISFRIQRKNAASFEDIDVHVQVLADGKDGTLPKEQAATNIDATRVSYLTPASQSVNNVVTKITKPLTVRGTVTIQTMYGPDATPDQQSRYGRGTTSQDFAAGDVTLGFHESCHRADYVAFLRNRPLPTFTGKIGMQASAFKQAETAFAAAFKKYWQDVEAESDRLTDEVGTKKSDYKRQNP